VKLLRLPWSFRQRYQVMPGLVGATHDRSCGCFKMLD
jgi:hypothetical protein